MLSELSMIPKDGNHGELYSVVVGWPLVVLNSPGWLFSRGPARASRALGATLSRDYIHPWWFVRIVWILSLSRLGPSGSPPEFCQAYNTLEPSGESPRVDIVT
jgi:hypothetical protein